MDLQDKENIIVQKMLMSMQAFYAAHPDCSINNQSILVPSGGLAGEHRFEAMRAVYYFLVSYFIKTGGII